MTFVNRMTSVALISATAIFFLLTLVYPFGKVFLYGLNPYDLKRIYELLFLGIIILLTLYGKDSENILSRMPLASKAILGVIFLLGIISSYVSELQNWAFLEVALDCLLFYFMVIVASRVIEWEEKADVVLQSLIYFAALIYLAYFAYFYIHMFAVVTTNQLKQFPGFVNPRFFAEFQAWTIAFIALPILQFKAKKYLGFLGFIILSLWWCLAIFNGSKALWFSSVIAIIGVSAIFKAVAGEFVWVQIKAAVIGFLWMLLIFSLNLTNFSLWSSVKISIATAAIIALAVVLFCGNIMQWLRVSHKTTRILGISIVAVIIGATIIDIAAFQHDYGAPLHYFNILTMYSISGSFVYGRFPLWQQAFYLIGQHPFIGVGPMHYAYYGFTNVSSAHPHNVILLIASEWGVPVVAIVLYLLLKGGYHWFSFCRTKLDNYNSAKLSAAPNLLVALTFTFIAGIINIQFDTGFITPLCQTMIALVLGWMLGYYLRENKIEEVRSAILSPWIVQGIAIASIGMVVFVVYPQLNTLSHSEVDWYRAHRMDANFSGFAPRFWIQGKIQ